MSVIPGLLQYSQEGKQEELWMFVGQLVCPVQLEKWLSALNKVEGWEPTPEVVF